MRNRKLIGGSKMSLLEYRYLKCCKNVARLTIPNLDVEIGLNYLIFLWMTVPFQLLWVSLVQVYGQMDMETV